MLVLPEACTCPTPATSTCLEEETEKYPRPPHPTPLGQDNSGTQVQVPQSFHAGPSPDSLSPLLVSEPVSEGTGVSG